jgi:predicted dehydrogenase
MHLPALRSHSDVCLTAICSRNPTNVARTAAEYDIPNAFTDFRSMLASQPLDAVFIVTPDDTHHEMTMAAIDAGCHVMCEKPLAPNATEARIMYESATAANRKHMVLFTNRWLPVYRHFRRLLMEGYVGDPWHVEARYLSGNRSVRPRYSWRYDSERANGVLGDLGSHVFDMLRYCIGDIVKVNANLGAYVSRPGPEGGQSESANDCADVLAEFDNGVRGILHIASASHLPGRTQEQGLTVFGSDGILELYSSYHGFGIRGARRDDSDIREIPVPDRIINSIKPFNMQEYITQVFRQRTAGGLYFVDCIQNNRDVSPSFYDGLRAQEIVDAALRSSLEGTWVECEARHD